MQKTSANWPEQLILPVSFISMLLILVISPLILLLHLPPLFRSEFREYNSYNNFHSYTQQTVNAEFSSVLNYLNFKQPGLDANFFSEEDLIHLSDVRNLIKTAYQLVIIAGTVMFLLLTLPQVNRVKFKKGVYMAGLVCLGAVVLFTIAYLTNFHALFIGFHELSFSNPYWQLDPATSNLIKYFPEQIFANLTGIWLCLSSLGGLFCIVSVKIGRRRENA